MSYTIDFSSGVYLKENDQSQYVQPISTSICAAVHPSNKGPIGRPRAITDVNEYYLYFGYPDPTVSLCPYSVIQALTMTSNMFVSRVQNGALYGGVRINKAIGNQLAAPTATVTQVAGTGAGTLSDGAVYYRVAATDAYGTSLPSTEQTFTLVSSPTHASKTIGTSNAALLYTSVAAGTGGNSNTITYTDPSANSIPLSVVITPTSGHASVVVTLGTNSSGTIITTANDLITLFAAQGAAFSDYLTVTLGSGSNGTGVVAAVASTALTGGAANGSNDAAAKITWTAVTGATGYKVYGRSTGAELLMATITDNTVLQYIDTGAVTPSGALPVANTTGQVKLIPFSAGTSDPATTYVWAAGDLGIIYGRDPGTWNNDLRVAITAVNATTGTFTFTIYRPGQTVGVEKWEVALVDQIDGYGQQLNMEDKVNSLSNVVAATINPNNAANAVVDQTATVPINMSGGDNGTTPTSADIINTWDQYLDPEEVPVRILINGGQADPAIQLKMDAICQARKDCVAILDVPSLQQQYQDAIDYRNLTLNLDSSYSALYTPDQYIVDPINNKALFVPPSGFVASALAYTDRNYAVWFAAAGMTRGDVKSLGCRYKYNQGQRNFLAESQVNYIRSFIGKGYKIWEQFTLQAQPSSLQLLNVRMLLIFLQSSIKDFLLYYVFDPNDEILRNRIKGQIRQFLDTVVAGRGLYRYNVVCDDSNNPPQSIQEGILNVTIYLDPVIPARRIVLESVITATGASFTEAVIASQNSINT